MFLTGLLDAVRQSEVYRQLLAELNAGTVPADQHIIRAARPYVVAALMADLQRPIIYLTGRVDRAHDIAEQLPVWLPDTPVRRFAEPPTMFYEHAPWTPSTIQNRLETLASMVSPAGVQIRPAPPLIVASAHAVMQRTLPVREYLLRSRRIKVGTLVEPDKLIRSWLESGYSPVSIVVEPGTFSRRGGILDVYSRANQYPIRIEFFGDEIESLRTFDPATQRSLENVESVDITPAREALPRYTPDLAGRLKEWFRKQPRPDEDSISKLPDQELLASGTAFPHLEFYLPYLYANPATLIDYLPDDGLVIIDDWEALRDNMADLEEQAIENRREKLRTDQIPNDYPLPYQTWDELQDALSTRLTLHLGRHPDILASPEKPMLGDLFSPGPRHGGQLHLFLAEIHRQTRGANQAVVVTQQAQRLAELWSEQASYVPPVTHLDQMLDAAALAFVEGTLSEGWILEQPAQRLHLYSDAEIFGWKRPEPRRLPQKRALPPEASFADLKPGDYVVHVEYGVGQFAGLRKRVIDDTEREYLTIEYAGSDLLYVPIHQADRISRYIGIDERPPQLNRLGTQEWTRTKQNAQRAVEEVARELLELYAARSHVQGHAFNPDTVWQHELEASFPYVETDDQLRALREVKNDMENSRPMDRLICGDVGYGKTEVALRAAFKAVMDAKQVAILVPTTVLAQQHLNTFARRLHPFPVKVEMLSRFRTPAQQRQILYELAKGQIDIVIGTHRLLQPDVQFKDLGLLIIDEEQRFGVTHKEQLKSLRTEVDVLTLTATPIPRTLYMSLTGVRDISMIQTPPDERLPIVTHVSEYDNRLVRQIILREIDRGGQVYFVHNRVQTIETIAARLRKLVPEAEFAVAHGQMDDQRLEVIMTAFARGDFDVLISTSIIESGLDIPNANTLIVDRADWFGLAQLYQLRGRVGRGANQAYAYFFHPRSTRLTAETRARLDTIAEETSLGAGLSIAMRDLELRGAGDLLGTRQSGHIAAIGFHLYTQLLAQTVRHMKGEGEAPHLPVATPTLTIDLPLPAYIPTTFIEETALRIQLYRRLADIATLDELIEIQAELIDRFGALPKALEGLLFQLEVKLLAEKANAGSIASENGQINIRLPYLGTTNRQALQEYLGRKVRVSRTGIWLPHQDVDPEQWKDDLLTVLRKLDLESIQSLSA